MAALTLATLDCVVATPDARNELCADARHRRPPTVTIEADGEEVVWRFDGLERQEEKDGPGEASSSLSFTIGKTTLIEQRSDALPEPQASSGRDFALENPLTGKERWSGHGVPKEEIIGRVPLTRVFAVYPGKRGFVADTKGQPQLRLAWAPSGVGDQDVELHFRADLAWDEAPDNRWTEPVLELRMSHGAYADLAAALRAIG